MSDQTNNTKKKRKRLTKSEEANIKGYCKGWLDGYNSGSKAGFVRGALFGITGICVANWLTRD
jgi:hypothetical protein